MDFGTGNPSGSGARGDARNRRSSAAERRASVVSGPRFVAGTPSADLPADVSSIGSYPPERFGTWLLTTSRRRGATNELPADSVFPDLSAASAYHECGAVGYCPSPDGERLEGVELATDEWRVRPLAVEDVHASFFERELPDDAVAFDNALSMRDIGHEWRPRVAIDAREHA